VNIYDIDARTYEFKLTLPLDAGTAAAAVVSSSSSLAGADGAELPPVGRGAARSPRRRVFALATLCGGGGGGLWAPPRWAG
jgi:hypothetical protein